MLSTISGARSSSEMSPSNPVNGHSFVIMMSHGLVFVTERRGSGRKLHGPAFVWNMFSMLHLLRSRFTRGS